MYVIEHKMLLGQDGNAGVQYKTEGRFSTKEDAEKYVADDCVHNGWHEYKIVEISEEELRVIRAFQGFCDEAQKHLSD